MIFQDDYQVHSSLLEDEEPSLSDLVHQSNKLQFGFNNHGNTCFLNSTLQCLLHVQVLEKSFSHLLPMFLMKHRAEMEYLSKDPPPRFEPGRLRSLTDLDISTPKTVTVFTDPQK